MDEPMAGRELSADAFAAVLDLRAARCPRASADAGVGRRAPQSHRPTALPEGIE